jgi:hypothetical protein
MSLSIDVVIQFIEIAFFSALFTSLKPTFDVPLSKDCP